MDDQTSRIVTDRSKTLSDDSNDDDVVAVTKILERPRYTKQGPNELEVNHSQSSKEDRDTNNSLMKDYEHPCSNPFNTTNEKKQLKTERDPPPPSSSGSGDLRHFSSILASPTGSMEVELCDQNWSPLLQQEQHQIPQNHHQIFRSPTTTTPTKLPQKQKQQRANQEEAAGLLTFFAHSFDTLSDSDTYIQDMRREEEGLDKEGKSHHHDVRLPSTSDRTEIDISLPALGHTRSCSSSIGDISPIKLNSYESTSNMDSTTDHQGHRRIYSLTQPTPTAESRHTNEPKTHPPYIAQNHNKKSSSATAKSREKSSRNDKPLLYNQPNLNHSQQQQGYKFADRNISNPIFVLKSNKKAFDGFVFLLPCLRAAESCPMQMSPFSHVHVYKGNTSVEPNARDSTIASRRVEAAVCFFGGSVTPREPMSPSIFRPQSSAGHEVHMMRSLRQKQLYDQRFDRRYFQTGSHISWDVEENPPVHVEPLVTSSHPSLHQSHTSAASSSPVAKQPKDKKSRRTIGKDNEEQHHFANSIEGENNGAADAEWPVESSGTGTTSPTNSVIAFSSGTEPPKMKYRCKLCGQPKQNHSCPFRRSLQRSIGVMVYPAVNSFSSHEPGKLAPPLNQMNNFVSYDSSGQAELSSLSSTSEHHHRRLHPYQQQEQVEKGLGEGSGTTSGTTGEPIQNSPTSSLLSSPACTPSHHHQSNVADDDIENHHDSHSEEVLLQPPNKTNTSKVNNEKQALHSPSPELTSSHANDNNTTPRPFYRSQMRKTCVQLRPEQFRSVSSSLPTDLAAYQYPTVPLPYAQKKRLTDTLFSLTQRIPRCTEDCAIMLRQAREKGMWDQGVAELMTQVVVALYCKEGDCQLVGLQKYLLSLGISC